MNEVISYELYLDRIGITRKVLPDKANLDFLLLQHLLHVPFENIDICAGIPVSLDLSAIYHKIVTRRRGGYCYECNHLFHALLIWLGYESRMISCRVIHDKKTGAPYDHMAVIVSLDQQEWLVDAGFGHFAIQPLAITPGIVQHDGREDYRIDISGSMAGVDYLSVSVYRTVKKAFTPIYLFNTAARLPEDFSAMNHYHQTSPDSHFTSRLICSRLTTGGRLSLINNRLVTTDTHTKDDLRLSGDYSPQDILQQYFGIYQHIPGIERFIRTGSLYSAS